MSFVRNWPYVIIGLFYVYLGYHALGGEQGSLKWAAYTDDVARLNAELEDVKARQEKLSAQIDNLRAGNLDRDLLEERARYSLNAAHPDEYIIKIDSAVINDVDATP